LREAFEEAGVRGYARKKPVGSYVYTKRIDKKGVTRDCLVEVFLVIFLKQEKKWPDAAKDGLSSSKQE
jgi:8-oxo-dGTP pyrophosphatase MutT (NUDIX family)